MSDSTSIFHTAIVRLLTPLVRILLRNGIPYREFAELAKRAYVQVAASDEFKIAGKKQTDSRISTITGLTRKDVLRLRTEDEDALSQLTSQYNRAAKVISAWIHDPEFCDDRGEPALLNVSGDENSFHALVKKSSGDITARTILDELIRVKAVRYTEDGMVQLISRAYIPHGNNAEKVKILGTDVADLIRTIDYNIRDEHESRFFQRKVCYDNLPEEVIPGLKVIIEQKAQAALEEMNKDMSACDRDSNPNIKGKGKKRAGIGIYYFEDDAEDTK